MENTVLGVGQVTNTAWGKAECCIRHEAPHQALYFLHITRLYSALIHFIALHRED